MKKLEADQLIQMIEGYRNINLLLYINTLQPKESVKELCKYWPIGIAQQLLKLANYIEYQREDVTLWKNLKQLADTGLPLLATSHVGIDLKAYVVGLYERNRLIWDCVELKAYLSFARGDILDFGCGAGFYVPWLADRGTVVGYDRPGIIEVARQMDLPHSHLLTDTLGEDRQFETVFLSEVAHGKSVTELWLLVKQIKEKYLDPDGIIVFNELLPGTALSNLFDIQMKVHCRGKLYKPEELVRVVGMKPTIFRTSAYHYCIGGKV